MLDALTITEEEAAGLSELAALDLAMAKDFAQRAQAAEDPAVANDLARSYQRVARSYRQTLALKMRLARDLAAVARETLETQPLPNRRAIERRERELRSAVERIAFAEYERSEDEEELAFTLDAFGHLLTELRVEPDFARQPLDRQVLEVCQDLELPPERAARWRELPEAPDQLPTRLDAWPEPGSEPFDTG